MGIYVIEDEMHAEWCGEYESLEKAIAELESRSRVGWDKKPNICPCTNWKKCCRNYEVIEYDDSKKPWIEKSRKLILNISAEGTKWEAGYGAVS